MADTVLQKEIFQAETQGFLRTGTPAIAIANTRFKSGLYKGYQDHLPYASTARVQTYSYATDLDMDQTTFTDDVLTIDQVKAATVQYDPLQNLTAHDTSWQTMLAEEASYQLSRNLNQYVANLGADNAATTVAGGALSASAVYEYLTDITTSLSRKRSGTGPTFGLVEPGFLALLAQNDVANGFMAADEALSNGYKGMTKAGVRIYECHDLPTSVTLTVDTQPTAGDTFTAGGYTWTVVADGTAATAGQVNRGANLADFQSIINDVLEGTTSADYVAFSTDQQREYKNSQMALSAFSGNVATLTAFGRVGASETFTAGSNVWGTETIEQVFGIVNSIDLVVQELPFVLETQEPHNAAKNIMTFGQWGGKVRYRNLGRLVKGTMTV